MRMVMRRPWDLLVVAAVTALGGCSKSNPFYGLSADADADARPADGPVFSTPDGRGLDAASADTRKRTGLLAYWKLDEGTGTVCQDSSGNGNVGGLYDPLGTASWNVGGFPSAMFANPASLDFHGTDSYVEMGRAPMLSSLRGLTVSAWIRPRSAGPDGLGRIVDKRQFAAGWQLFMCGPPQMECPGGMRLHFRQTFSITEGAWGTTAGTLAPDAWQHVAVAYDATSAGNNPVAYINGIPTPLTRAETPTGDPLPDDVVTLTVGSAVSGQRSFDGIIDDVRIYGRMLTAQEIGMLVSGSVGPAQ